MTTHAQGAPVALSLSDTLIRQDAEGRFCLNDLHKASGGLAKHRPNYWLSIQQTKDLIAELGDAGIPASVKGGHDKVQGTYVCRELVLAYATWISPAFFLKVLRTFDAATTNTPAPVTNQRWLLTFGPDGRQYMAAIPADAYILEPHQFAGVIGSPEFGKPHLQKVMEAITNRTGFVFSTYQSLHRTVGVIMAVKGLIDAIVVPAVHKLEEETGQELYNRSDEDHVA